MARPEHPNDPSSPWCPNCGQPPPKPHTDPVARRTYSPDEEVARKAPAVICAIASRTLRLRARLEEMRKAKPEVITLHDIERMLHDYVAPLPFEAELLSGDYLKVDHAIRNIAS